MLSISACKKDFIETFFGAKIGTYAGVICVIHGYYILKNYAEKLCIWCYLCFRVCQSGVSGAYLGYFA